MTLAIQWDTNRALPFFPERAASAKQEDPAFGTAAFAKTNAGVRRQTRTALRTNEGTAVQRALKQAGGAEQDWENAALYNQMRLIARLFARQDETEDGKNAEESIGAAQKGGANLDEPAAVRTRREPEQWVLKTSAQEVLEQMHSGSFRYYAEDGAFCVQGKKEDGTPGVKKMCSLKDLQEAFGHTAPEQMAARHQTVTFAEDAAYAFTGRDGKTHTVLSCGGWLTEDMLSGAEGEPDREAQEYADFWNRLVRGDMDGLFSRFDREEIQKRLTDAGVRSGLFAVSAGGRTQLCYLPQQPKVW